MKVTLKITRYNPETDTTPYVQDFTVEAEPTDRLLDALMDVKHNQDGTLGVRKSCAHGVCGSDGMVVNGVEQLACKTLIKEIAGDDGVITVEPLRSMAVQRDLIVDQEPFFEKYRAVKPYLISQKQPERGEFTQSPEDREKIDDPTKCILCSSCYSACPVVQETNPDFIGPAAVVQAARFMFDSRDEGDAERLPALDDENGVWPCENHFNCTKVCPRDIKVTRTINQTKRRIKELREEETKESRH